MTSQHAAYALHAGLARLYARIHMHTPTRPGNRMHVRTRKHAHTDQYIILIAFQLEQLFRYILKKYIKKSKLPVLFKVIHTVHFLYSISLFTNKMHDLNKNTIIILLLGHGSSLMYHFLRRVTLVPTATQPQHRASVKFGLTPC